MFHKNVSISGGRGVRLGSGTRQGGFGVSAGVSNGVRIKGGGAAPEGAYASGGRSVSASLNGVTE